LTGGAVEAILAHGSDELKKTFLPRMVEGVWSGTMNLTESQAGSDLSAIRTRAEPQADGSYRIFGQKIFITFGEHDLTENIIHLVLARLPDAPPGVKGISLFLVPKILVNFADGSLGGRNDVRCISIEHKMGIRASPTCTMVYGEKEGATGYLIGKAHHGLAYMFTMMNEARLAVGGEGIALAERAYQQALAYARERTQGRDMMTGEPKVPIIRHPDVRRMLLTMRSRIEAARALSLMVAGMIDHAHRNPDAAERERNFALVELLTPVVKACSTEMAIDVTSLNIQIHGGMGFIEETGAAQHFRDARITTIYEGTTGIQANDLIGRKILREEGATLNLLIGKMRETAEALRQSPRQELVGIAARLGPAIDALGAASGWVLATGEKRIGLVLAGAVPFLHLTGTVCAGWLMGIAALAAARRLADGDADRGFLEAKIMTAQFYCNHELPHAESYALTVMAGDDSLLSMGEAQF
jgi:alkylation response protein AidB-like acyl-CoA dehydrogenase